MQAGRLDRRLTIQKKTVTQNSAGEEIETWSTHATVSAIKLENRGAERFTSQQLLGEGVKTFQIRWSNRVKALTSEHRILFDNRIHEIKDIRELGRREGIEIDCTVRNELPMAS